jgi:hypothetical protein
MVEGSKMVIERSVIAARPDASLKGCMPTAYRVVIRIDNKRESGAVALLVEKAFGHAQMSCRIGSPISGRIWLEIGPYPREIAEARAEIIRRNARLGRMDLAIHIRKAT